MFKNLGKNIGSTLEEFGEATHLGGRVLFCLLKRTFHFREVVVQTVRIGVDSLPAALTAAAFVAMVFAVQIASEFVRFGAGGVVGGVMAVAVARELAPAFMAVIMAGRIGAAIAAELGSMKVTEQIEALEAMGSDPVKHLVAPRFLACSFMLPVITIFADLIGFFAAYLVAVYIIGVNAVGYMQSAEDFLKVSDITGGILKAFIFGMLIAIIACHKGLRARGGARGVGEATTASVVTSLIAIFIANYFLSLALFKS